MEVREILLFAKTWQEKGCSSQAETSHVKTYTDTQKRASLRSNKDQLCVSIIREVSVIQKSPL